MAYPRLRSLEVLLVSSLGHEIEVVVARIHHINAALAEPALHILGRFRMAEGFGPPKKLRSLRIL